MATYHFAVRMMTQNPNTPERRSPRDRWLPSKRPGSNIAPIPPGHTTSPTFFFQHAGGHTTRASGIPRAAQRYKACSIYYRRGKLLYVNFDATGPGVQIGDGHDQPGADIPEPDTDGEDDDNAFDDWTEVTFGRVPDNPGNGCLSVSNAGRRQQFERLVVRRPSQRWIHHFLPQRYYTGTPLAPSPQHGGLVGDLALLIGIVAMSQPFDRRSELLPLSVGRWFQVHQNQVSTLTPADAWDERRGVVVTVWTIPNGSTPQQLAGYERGDLGPIFP